MNPPLIETRTLSKHFGGVQAVRNIDFSLAEGELRCLIGPNGAGKSTFFKLLTGQIKPTGGAVLFRGVDITKLQAHEIARLGIGIKTQVPSVFKWTHRAAKSPDRGRSSRHQEGSGCRR
jgi:branched-chain amino acid transport system ATP-binding protein